jgi:prepilin-type N-terminal cleavage/methylation domain-containing protein
VRRGFTLIEVLVATAILALTITLFSSLIMNYKKSADWFSRKTDSEASLALVSQILYNDLLSATKFETIGDGNRQIVRLQTMHSLYGIQNPYVVWYVLVAENRLVRLESSNSFNIPITNLDNKYSIFTDSIAKDCNKFLVYQANGAIFISVVLGGDKFLKFALPRLWQ